MNRVRESYKETEQPIHHSSDIIPLLLPSAVPMKRKLSNSTSGRVGVVPPRDITEKHLLERGFVLERGMAHSCGKGEQ